MLLAEFLAAILVLHDTVGRVCRHRVAERSGASGENGARPRARPTRVRRLSPLCRCVCVSVRTVYVRAPC